MRRWQQLAIGVLAGLVLLAGQAGVARAHAELVGAEPGNGAVLDRAPQQVRLFFSEPIEHEFFALEVYSADRVRVDRRDARIPPDNVAALEVGLGDLGPGTYTVLWRVLSIDGHVVRNSFAFTVGVGAAPGQALRIDWEAGGAPFGLAAAVRWLTFLAALALVGGFGFAPLILWPAMAVAGASSPAAVKGASRRFLWVAWPAVVLLLALGLGALLLQAADATGLPLGQVLGERAVTRLLVGTKYGVLWLARMGLLVGLLIIVAVATVEVRTGRKVLYASLGLGVAFLSTLALGGHASAVAERSALAVGADWLHLLAAALWVGGLVQLAVALPPALRTLDSDRRRALLGSVVRRFSFVAGASVAALVATGVYAGLIHVPSWQALLDTVYGAALSGKLLVAVPLLLIGAVNLLVMHPRFVEAARAKIARAEDVAGHRIFRALVAGEIVLGAAVLGATGILTGLPPATTVPSEGRPFADTRHTQSLAVTLAVSPNQAGDNRIEVAVGDHQGRPLAGVQRVALAMRHMDMEMGEREAMARPVDDGQYEAGGGYLSMAGRWQVEVRVDLDSGALERARFTPVVGQAPGANRPAFSPARIVLLALNLRALLAILLLAAACFVWVSAAKGRRYAFGSGAVLGGALVVAGLGLGGVTVADAYRRSLPNPVPADAASLVRGQAVYEQDCAACHGIFGRGDGPAGQALRPRPADFRIHMAAGHTDQELFEWVTRGVDGTGMPAFGSQLAEQERWDVINYIRTFANPVPVQGREQ